MAQVEWVFEILFAQAQSIDVLVEVELVAEDPAQGRGLYWGRVLEQGITGMPLVTELVAQLVAEQGHHVVHQVQLTAQLQGVEVTESTNLEAERGEARFLLQVAKQAGVVFVVVLHDPGERFTYR